MRLSSVDQMLLGLSQILEKSVRDVRVGQLILNNGVRADLGIGRRSVTGCHPIRGRTHQLCVGLDRELNDK